MHKSFSKIFLISFNFLIIFFIFQIFNGNCDHFSPVLNQFKNSIRARYIRYRPWNWNFPCVRMEFYGCWVLFTMYKKECTLESKCNLCIYLSYRVPTWTLTMYFEDKETSFSLRKIAIVKLPFNLPQHLEDSGTRKVTSKKSNIVVFCNWLIMRDSWTNQDFLLIYFRCYIFSQYFSLPL